jgi:hypothetical protein
MAFACRSKRIAVSVAVRQLLFRVTGSASKFLALGWADRLQNGMMPTAKSRI